MELSGKPVGVDEILPWRDLYRQEMNCQIVHDSLHYRKGWTQSYFLHAGNFTAGYGAVAVAGPWKGKPTAFEFYILPQYRSRAFDFFRTLLDISGAVMVETQTNDALMTVMLYAFGQTIANESILFHDRLTTAHAPTGAVFRRVAPEDSSQIAEHKLDAEAEWVVTMEGKIAAAGDILYHYNRPYGDIYMKVAEPFRKRGLGGYLVQELKRVCYERGNVPAARCNPTNTPSRKTLQKAGFVPCAIWLNGSVCDSNHPERAL
jgi:GNAT superfamily N-acetyltransferase